MTIPFFETQSELLFLISSWRTEVLDGIFRFLNYFDDPYFLLVLIPFVWVSISQRWGLRIAYLLIFNTLVNHGLKIFFDLPRPIAAFPNLPMFPFHTPGFPSGAAQMTFLLGSLLIHEWKNRWAWMIGITYILLISFSRLYLGVHYPMDILGGWVVGLGVCLAYIRFEKSIERFLSKQSRGLCIVLVGVIGIIYFIYVPKGPAYQLGGAFFGFGLGAYLSSVYRLNQAPPRAFWAKIIHGIIAVFSVFFLYTLTHKLMLPAPVQAFCVALWISFGACPFCRTIDLY